MYTVKSAAQLVGISSSTLRAWERRYAVTEPKRTAAGYRIYSEADVELLRRMAELVESGQTPSLAAEQVLQASEIRAEPDHGATAIGGQLGNTLVNSAVDGDSEAITAALDKAFARSSYEAVIDDELMPALAALGDGWACGVVSVAAEHLAANAVLHRLAGTYAAAASRTGGPRVLIGAPAGTHHELGLLAFATAARRRGLTTDYLGANVPTEDWIKAIAIADAAAIVLPIPMDDDLSRARQAIRAITKQHPKVLIAVGGGQQDRAPKQALRLGHDIKEAADLLALELQGAQSTARRSSR